MTPRGEDTSLRPSSPPRAASREIEKVTMAPDELAYISATELAGRIRRRDKQPAEMKQARAQVAGRACALAQLRPAPRVTNGPGLSAA